jgi:hypothetical protein
MDWATFVSDFDSGSASRGRSRNGPGPEVFRGAAGARAGAGAEPGEPVPMGPSSCVSGNGVRANGVRVGGMGGAGGAGGAGARKPPPGAAGRSAPGPGPAASATRRRPWEMTEPPPNAAPHSRPPPANPKVRRGRRPPCLPRQLPEISRTCSRAPASRPHFLPPLRRPPLLASGESLLRQDASPSCPTHV